MSEENKIVELKNNELEKINGGTYEYSDSAGYQYDGYNVVNGDWGCPCEKEGYKPSMKLRRVALCRQCFNYNRLPEPINGWDGYCAWKKVQKD